MPNFCGAIPDYDLDMAKAQSYFMDGEPYFEGSFGISNIFKFLRVDFVKRFTHLDHPNTPNAFGVPGGGIRFRIKVEF